VLRFGFFSALVAFLVATSSVTRAEEPETPSETSPIATVEIVVVGSEEQLEALRSTIGPASFDGASVRWARSTRLETGELLEERPQASELGVRAWVDLGDERNASLYFADRAGERFLVRAVALPEGLSPLGREALGQVLELSVRALLEDDRIGMSRAETTELLNARATQSDLPAAERDTPPEPEPPVLHESQSSLGAEAFYGARLFSSEVSVVHGPGLGLGWITESSSFRSIVWVSGHYELPEEHRTKAVSVEWRTVRVEGGFGLAFPVSTSFFAGGRVGVGADVTSFSPRPGTASGDVTLEPTSVSTAPVLSAAVEGMLPLGRRFSVSARALVSFYPIRVHYDLARGSEQAVVLDPYRIRPGIELCLHLR
jgi:hypothetical protein